MDSFQQSGLKISLRIFFRRTPKSCPRLRQSSSNIPPGDIGLADAAEKEPCRLCGALFDPPNLVYAAEPSVLLGKDEFDT